MFIFNSHSVNLFKKREEEKDNDDKEIFAVNYLFENVVIDNIREIEGAAPIFATESKRIF